MTQPTPITEVQPDNQYIKKQFPDGFYPLNKLGEIIEDSDAHTNDLIQDLVAESSVNVLVGDSGTGKSPLAYEISNAIATGNPLFGLLGVQQGPVLYFDLENGLKPVHKLNQQLARFFKQPDLPSNLYIRVEPPGSVGELEALIKPKRPRLVVIDSLYAWMPNVPNDPKLAAGFMTRLRGIARRCQCAFLIIHHIRKPLNGLSTPNIEKEPILSWLNNSSGARPLINESDTRFGFQVRAKSAEEMLVLRAHQRLIGDLGTRYLVRQCDENGDPLGYKLATALNLLGNREQEQAFRKLPSRFMFKQAKEVYGKTDNPTREFLKKLEALGLIRKVRRGLYEKSEGGEVREEVRQVA